MEQQPNVAPVLAEEEMWSSPTDHFRPRHRHLTLFTDHDYVVDKWLNFKTTLLNRWYVPFWTPLYFGLTHLSQRNRNLFLVENHMNYRPYKWRRNDETSKY
jgi:hypothetical protein